MWSLIKQLCPRLYKHGISFECGLGWYDILYDLSLKIEKILEEDAENHKCAEGDECDDIEMYAVQVKEKYGTLRFYMTCETEEIRQLIEMAQRLSSRTCENCGEPGKSRGMSWIEVRCNNCYGGRDE